MKSIKRILCLAVLATALAIPALAVEVCFTHYEYVTVGPVVIEIPTLICWDIPTPQVPSCYPSCN